MLAEAPAQIPPAYSHVHEWKLRYFARDYRDNPEIIAVCTVRECGARLTQEEAEAVLNGGVAFSGLWVVDESENG